MSENNKVRLFSYNKVWKVEKKIYAIQNLTLPVPVRPYDILYFSVAVAVIFILGNIFPLFKSIPTAIRFVIIPYGVTNFLTKKRLDGKNPIKYFIGYIYYIFAEKNSYIEKFKMYPDRKEESIKISWVCSRGYSKKPLWDYNRLFNSKKKGKDKKKRTSASKRGTSPKKNKKKPVEKTSENKKTRISSGPRVKTNTYKNEKKQVETTTAELKSFGLEKKIKRFYREIVEVINDPKTKETVINTAKFIIERLAALQKSLKKNRVNKKITAEKAGINTAAKTGSNNKDKNNKEKQPKIKAEKKVPMLENITLTISVCSLAPGAGCTHTVKALAYYIKHEIKKSVCIIDVKGEASVKELNGIEVFKKESLYDLYDRYKYIILDVGKYDAATHKELKQSQIKIMCALVDNNYLQTLAEFIENEEGAGKWKYIFNHVPKNMKTLVDDKMEDYEYWCMPVNDAMTFEKGTAAVFCRLVKGERI